jgi:hypothetical protein
VNPLVVSTFFADPSDFPHLRHFEFDAFWPAYLSSHLKMIVNDPRRWSPAIDGGVFGHDVQNDVLEAVVDRLEARPGSLRLSPASTRRDSTLSCSVSLGWVELGCASWSGGRPSLT